MSQVRLPLQPGSHTEDGMWSRAINLTRRKESRVLTFEEVQQGVMKTLSIIFATSLIIREGKIKLKWDITSYLSGWLLLKKKEVLVRLWRN